MAEKKITEYVSDAVYVKIREWQLALDTFLNTPFIRGISFSNEMEKKKVTKHVVGDVYCLLNNYLKKHKEENFKITGLEFSNLGAQGREPLFDASRCQKGTIMAYWKDECKNCIVISAPEPGYDIKAPKCLSNYFCDWKLNRLDVSHLDVSRTTDFYKCFSNFGSVSTEDGCKSSEIIGLETWDVSNGENFAFMFKHCLSSNKTINLNLSSWQFNQKITISFWGMFKEFGAQANEIILDVNGWNVTKVNDFNRIFDEFASHAKTVKLKGVENWRLGTGTITMKYAFNNFAKESGYCLDLSELSKECTTKPDMEGFAKGAFFRIKEPKWAD